MVALPSNLVHLFYAAISDLSLYFNLRSSFNMLHVPVEDQQEGYSVPMCMFVCGVVCDGWTESENRRVR